MVFPAIAILSLLIRIRSGRMLRFVPGISEEITLFALAEREMGASGRSFVACEVE
jgi:hypothetical protein